MLFSENLFLFSASKDSTKLKMSSKGHLLNVNVGVFLMIFSNLPGVQDYGTFRFKLPDWLITVGNRVST